MNASEKWKTISETGPIAVNVRSAPIVIGSSIWFAHTTKLVGYYPDRNKSYTFDFPQKFHTMVKVRGKQITPCKYNDHHIVIVSTAAECGLVFDTKRHEFDCVLLLRGKYDIEASCVLLGDFMHIFHGELDIPTNKGYSIQSMSDRKRVKCVIIYPRLLGDLGEREQGDFIQGGPVINSDDCYQSGDTMLISGFVRMDTTKETLIPVVLIDLISKFSTFEVFKFTGWHRDDWDIGSFYIGTLKNGDPAKSITWKFAPQYMLKREMTDFGYIKHGPFIVIFGGAFRLHRNSDDWCNSDDWFSNKIYTLDLRKNHGWVKSPITVPEGGTYHAALTESGQVHLWSSDDYHSGKHWSIEVGELIPS